MHVRVACALWYIVTTERTQLVFVSISQTSLHSLEVLFSFSFRDSFHHGRCVVNKRRAFVSHQSLS
jgi:hypothetical protein